MIDKAAVLSVNDTDLAEIFSASSMTTRIASPARAPSKTSTSSASAVEAVATDCLPAFHRSRDDPHMTKWQPMLISPNEASL